MTETEIDQLRRRAKALEDENARLKELVHKDSTRRERAEMALADSEERYRALFDSIDEFQASFAEHGQTILSDLPNYTNTQPVVQISQVKLLT